MTDWQWLWIIHYFTLIDIAFFPQTFLENWLRKAQSHLLMDSLLSCNNRLKTWMPHMEVFLGQFSSIQSLSRVPTLCDPMNRSTPGLPVHHYLPEFTQTHVHWVGDAIQPSHPLLFPFPPAPNPSQHQSLFQWVNSSHEVAKVLKFQL